MTKRRHAPISALLAFALLCLLPAALFARPTALPTARSRHPKAVAATRSQHTSRRAHAVAPPHQRRAVQTANHQAGRHRKQVAAPRSRTRRRSAPVQQAIVAETKPAPPATPAIKAKTAPETQETGVSHPPDFDDAGPAATSGPIASILRSSPTLEDAVVTPEILPSLYNKRGRLIMPPPLRGSREILLHQNEVAERDGLERVQDDADLESMRRRGALVALPVNAGIQVDERLPFNRRYSRPWTAVFLLTLARAHYARFHTPLQINSAVRTVEFQQRLIRTNGNAAPARGETASPHLTGQAVDLAKHGLSPSEIAWMRGYLLPLVQEGKIDVEEEFQQACFHISVYRKYLPPASVPRRSIAATHRDSPASLAIAIP